MKKIKYIAYKNGKISITKPSLQTILQKARQLRSKSSKYYLTDKKLPIIKKEGRL